MQISKEISFIIKAIKTCPEHRELEAFLTQLLSPREVREIYNRLRACEMLLEDLPYTSIVRDTGVSSATVARISKLLKERGSSLRHVFYTLYGKEKYLKLKQAKTLQYSNFEF